MMYGEMEQQSMYWKDLECSELQGAHMFVEVAMNQTNSTPQSLGLIPYSNQGLQSRRMSPALQSLFTKKECEAIDIKV